MCVCSPGGYYMVVHATSTLSPAVFTVTIKSQLAVSPLQVSAVAATRVLGLCVLQFVQSSESVCVCCVTPAMQDGEPAYDSVAPGVYKYYSFSVANSSLDVFLDLTPYTGDADMFVSCYKNPTGDNTGTPSRNNNTWNSQLWGEDTLAIPHTDPRSCVNTAGGGGGTFYIGVYGFVNSSYSISASVDDGACCGCACVCLRCLCVWMCCYRALTPARLSHSSDGGPATSRPSAVRTAHTVRGRQTRGCPVSHHFRQPQLRRP